MCIQRVVGANDYTFEIINLFQFRIIKKCNLFGEFLVLGVGCCNHFFSEKMGKKPYCPESHSYFLVNSQHHFFFVENEN